MNKTFVISVNVIDPTILGNRFGTVKDFYSTVDKLYDILWDKDLVLPTENEEKILFNTAQHFFSKRFGTNDALRTFPRTEKMNYNMCVLAVANYWVVPCTISETFFATTNVVIEIDD